MLKPNDVLIINNTKVIPARLYGCKDTGGKVELLLLNLHENIVEDSRTKFCCHSLIKSSKRLKNGSYIFFDSKKAKVAGFNKGIYLIEFASKDELDELIYTNGKMPLPPYIKRAYGDRRYLLDETSYQTIYASKEGAIASPTAGFHFTPQLIDKIRSAGIEIVEITLHVGYGTFLPVKVKDIRKHKIHSENFVVSKEAAQKIESAKQNCGRVIAVGTTSVRALEFVASNTGSIEHKSGVCDIFIYPHYKFKVVDAMITNFHLPKSTLLMLVSAFAGRDTILTAYEEAIKKGYRFYSYGDAMIIF